MLSVFVASLLMMKMMYVARYYIMCVLYIYLCVVSYDDGKHLFMCVCVCAR